ncbi:MAG TPA: class II fumarate hydratase [Verrucomicrobiae bacterium]|nr:class II fumarate hydratase [Verrucomicrobiae bacterium]
MKQDFRTESDSMGEMRVPAEAYYGAQTARAIENFPISGLRFPRSFIRALGLIKKCASSTNLSLGLIPEAVAKAIEQAAQEVIDGRFDTQFAVDIFQTGSGTSTNMNANEVIANRAAEILGKPRGDKMVHPNDHVNQGQSSNDVIPSALHLAALEGLVRRLIPSLELLEKSLSQKSGEFAEILKIGRTHLQDATPMRLGQEFSGYASQVRHGIERLQRASGSLSELALGGTAVGTGINTHPEFAARAIRRLAEETDLPLREAANHFEAQASIDACVETSGALKTVAISLIKIANDIRLLASGPRCGLGELRLPATQPGSSIMPGKVNPVMSEMVIQVCAQVLGSDAVISFSGTFGFFELNTMLPVTAFNLLQAIDLLANACAVFSSRCVSGLEANEKKCESNLEQSLAMCTALAPEIGYDKAAKIAKKAFETERTVREVAMEMSGLPREKIEQLLDPRTQSGSAR